MPLLEGENKFIVFDNISYHLIQHLGYIFTLLSLSIKDILWLRVILVIAQVTLAIYQLVIARYDVMVWNMLFTIVNTYHIIRIANERKPVKIPEEINDIYNNVFYNMTSKAFIYLWNLGKYCNGENKVIIKEGENQIKLFMILQGVAKVTRNEKTLTMLNRGDFIAEMSFLTEEPASADVYLEDNVKYIMWNQEELRHMQKLNTDFWGKLHNVLTRDLIKKIKS